VSLFSPWLNPDRAEMFFADRVVFVEGPTEKAVLPFVAEKLSIFNPDVTIVDCGGKRNLPLYITLANAFKLKYVVVHDEDPVPDPVPTDWDEARLREQKNLAALNREISELVDQKIGEVRVIEDDFETAFGVPKSQAKKKGKVLAAIEHFDGTPNEKLPPSLTELVAVAYAKS
jgi:CRISPR-associated exonuclease Cas4